MTVLYRKYRPQTFNEVIGQQPIVQTLRNAVTAGTPAHAYLFTGSRGVGKTSVARIFARAVNCQNLKDGEACLKCAICIQMNEGNFLDLVEIDAASNTGVDNIRDLVEHVKFSPSQGKYKVFIIDEVHMLSKGAFNALLKTLEEPPAHAIFILATTESHRVPLTIVSRTQRFDFQRVSRTDIARYLEKISKQEKLKFIPEILDLIAIQAGGSLRDALSLLGKLASAGGNMSLAEAERSLGVTSFAASAELLDIISAGDPAKLPGLIDGFIESGVDFGAFNKNFLEYVRTVLVSKIGTLSVSIGLVGEELERVRAHAAELSTANIIFITRLFLRSLKDMAAAPSADLPFLLAGIEACYKCAGQEGEPAIRAPHKVSAITPPAVPSAMAHGNTTSKAVGSESGLTVDASVTEAEVRLHWNGILDALKKINSPLATLLKNSPIVRVDGGIVTVEVHYLFHKEHLESAKNRSVICAAARQVMGKLVGIAAQFNKVRPVSESEQKTVLSDALRVFGGELVE